MSVRIAAAKVALVRRWLSKVCSTSHIQIPRAIIRVDDANSTKPNG
jgi:hypothetical protein